MKTFEMICPQCGAALKTDSNERKAFCEYCGYKVLIKKEETPEEIFNNVQQKSYEYHKGKLRAEEEHTKKKKFRSILIPLIVVLGIIICSVLSIGIQEMSKPKLNPFEYIEVSFHGIDGDGKVIINPIDTPDEIDLNYIEFDISKERNLFLGDTITISATTSNYRLTETSKVYTVVGLDEYLKDLDDISEEALETIHVKATSRLELNLYRAKNTGFFIDMKPVKLFLSTDGNQTNALYDVFEARFNTSYGEKIVYVVAYFDDVVVRTTAQTSIDMSYGMYIGPLIQIQYSLWLTGYTSLEEIKADILTNQESYMELKELDL